MNETIKKALGYLNGLDIRGERNCVLLASAILSLKSLLPSSVAECKDEQTCTFGRDETKGG